VNFYGQTHAIYDPPKEKPPTFMPGVFIF